MKILITGICGFTGSTRVYSIATLIDLPVTIENEAYRPQLVLDSATAKRQWDWQPTVGVEQILEEIAQHAQAHAEWLEISGGI